MAYVVCEPCVRCTGASCVEVCPADCFYADGSMFYIHPAGCIDCGACVPECPVEAIFAEADVPPRWRSWIVFNAQRAPMSERRRHAPAVLLAG